MEKEIFNIDKTEFKKEVSKVNESLEKPKEESYTVESVTSMVKSDAIISKGTGEGASWGSVVHRTLELCSKGEREKLPILAPNWLIEENRPVGDITKLITVIDKIIAGDIWKRMMKAEKKYFEIPFGIMDKTTLISGAIDLIFKESDGWVIVDYKTDDFEADTKKKQMYQNQLDLYKKYWQSITDEKVKSTLLYKV